MLLKRGIENKEDMQTRRPCNPNGCNSTFSHTLVTACFLLFSPFYHRLLISENKTYELNRISTHCKSMIKLVAQMGYVGGQWLMVKL